jgi:D-sedoheptulose 7-phosphate isomerase
MSAFGEPLPCGRTHVAEIRRQMDALDAKVDELEDWGRQIAAGLLAGHRLLAAGNGGSAAQAQHLTSELVGRYRDDRRAFSAIALHGETSSLTAIVNDYGVDEGFARQVRAHGRHGDILVALSTSGRSRNVLCAVDAARACGLHTFALTGPAPNPLARAADRAFGVDAPHTATVQEVHQIVIHLLCATIDVAVGASAAGPSADRLGQRAGAVR